MKKVKDLKRTLNALLDAGVKNILISGAPGIGKSEIAYQVAQERGLTLYEVRLYEQGEAAVGFPRLDTEVTKFTKPFWFDRIEKDRPDIVFFDDFHLVPGAIQQYLYRFLTSRQIHDYTLDYTPTVIVAGNFNIDTAGACDIQAPVMNRFDAAVTFEPDLDKFVVWGFETGRIDPRIIAFLKANPDLFYTPDPPPTAMFPSPRSWEKLSKLLVATGDPTWALATVGSEAGARFVDFWKLLDRDVSEIIAKDPSSMEKAERVAAVHILSEVAGVVLRRDKNVNSVLKWVEKLDPEEVFLWVKACIVRLTRGVDKREKEMIKKRFATSLAVLSDSSPDSAYAKATAVAICINDGYTSQEKLEESLKAALEGQKRIKQKEGAR